MANLVNKSHIFRQQKPLEKLLLCQHITHESSQLRCAASKRRRIPIIHPVILSFPNTSLYNSISIRCCSFILIVPVFPLGQRRFSPFVSPMPASLTSDASSNSKTVRVEIKGRVQGVFYRDWTVGNAKELGLKGWVRNRRDGSVEALFSGSSEKVEEMEQRCRRGPPQAMVTGLQVFPCSDDPGNSFERSREFWTGLNRYMRRLRAKCLQKVEEKEGKQAFPNDVKEGQFAIIVEAANEEHKPIRLVVELCILKHPRFLRLLELAEEEYGLQHKGPLAIPCQPDELQRILQDLDRL